MLTRSFQQYNVTCGKERRKDRVTALDYCTYLSFKEKNTITYLNLFYMLVDSNRTECNEMGIFIK